MNSDWILPRNTRENLCNVIFEGFIVDRHFLISLLLYHYEPLESCIKQLKSSLLAIFESQSGVLSHRFHHAFNWRSANKCRRIIIYRMLQGVILCLVSIKISVLQVNIPTNILLEKTFASNLIG